MYFVQKNNSDMIEKYIDNMPFIKININKIRALSVFALCKSKFIYYIQIFFYRHSRKDCKIVTE